MGNAVCPPRENDELDQFNGDDELDMRKMNDFSKPSINDKVRSELDYYIIQNAP